MSVLTIACAACGAHGPVHDGTAVDYITGEAFGVYRCPSCDVAFTSPRPTSMDAYYPAGYRRYAWPVVELLRRLYAVRVRRWTRGRAPGRVLEVGCGAGWMLQALAQRGWRVVGLERTVEQASFATGVLKVPVVVGGLEALRDEAGFDLIFMFHVLEHLPDPRETLRTLARKLARKGRLIVEVPSADDALLKLYECKPFSEFTYWSCHLFLFTPATLSALGEQAGLKAASVDQVQRFPLSNHMYWLSKGKPGGHKEWAFLDAGGAAERYERRLAAIGRCDTLMASFSAR
jgi:SAM-dependent methyltransferase